MIIEEIKSNLCYYDRRNPEFSIIEEYGYDKEEIDATGEKAILMWLLFLLLIIVWIFPILISFYTHNFWFILLYIVWAIPAAFLTILIKDLAEILDNY